MTDPTAQPPQKFDPGAIVSGWWRANLADRETGVARGLAARLRRADTIELLCEPAVHELARNLDTRNPARIARLVRTLAELRGHSNRSLPWLLGAGGDEPLLSPSRFERLMRAEGDELTLGLVRAVRMLGPADTRHCDIAALGRDLYWWADSTRADWCFAYFHTEAPGTARPAERETAR